MLGKCYITLVMILFYYDFFYLRIAGFAQHEKL